jgi:uncharacterized protein YjhX (UPF0386 family)
MEKNYEKTIRRKGDFSRDGYSYLGVMSYLFFHMLCQRYLALHSKPGTPYIKPFTVISVFVLKSLKFAFEI